MPERNQLKEVRFIGSLVTIHGAFRLVTKQKHHGGRAWQENDAHLMMARKKRERERGQGQDRPLKGISVMTAFSNQAPN
jgi:hypothetical protein